MSSRDPENFSLGRYEDDDVILSGKATILRSKPQARAQSLTEVQTHTLSPPFTIHSSPSQSLFGAWMSTPVTGHWKKAFRGVGNNQALNRALLKKGPP